MKQYKVEFKKLNQLEKQKINGKRRKKEEDFKKEEDKKQEQIRLF